jgi:hypothetical protein
VIKDGTVATAGTMQAESHVMAFPSGGASSHPPQWLMSAADI